MLSPKNVCSIFFAGTIFADHWKIAKIGTPKTSATQYLSPSLLNKND